MSPKGMLSHVLLAAILGLCSSSIVFSQKIALPPELNERSSLNEIFDWLNGSSLPQARIGLEANAPGAAHDEIPTTATRYYELAIFSKGFKLTKIDGCIATLRNDTVDLLDFSTKYPDPAEGSLGEFRKVQNDQKRFAGEFSIPLHKLKANKSPFRHTKRDQRADVLGTWRTEFKWNPGFLIPSKKKMKSLLENTLKIEVLGSQHDGRNESMSGDELTFTFDDKQTSENFFAAFSRAIDLCKGK